ncbi:MAG TPA: gliding motility-associated C-terminal domain-containing protein [Bacteroidia bacterium]|nr:gliding motility-associated C-terminal domain-containing protein [Bacteroidia bacterium]
MPSLYRNLLLLLLIIAQKSWSQCALTLFPSSEYDCTTQLAVVGYTIGGSGGMAPYTCTFVNVSNNATVATGSTSTNTGTVINLPMGVYNVYVTSANNCTVVSPGFNITFNQTVSNSSFNTTGVTCYGGSNGIAFVVPPLSFSVPLSFTWSPGSYTTQGVNTLSSGIVYSVTVADAQGCMVTNTVSVTQPAEINTGVSQVFIPCFGGTILATPSTSGGVAPYTYTLNGTATGTSMVLSAGVQTLVTKDANQCLKTNTLLITSAPQVVITFSTFSPSCPGNSDGSINAFISNAPLPCSFVWQPLPSSSSNLNNVPAGNYTLTVADASSCVTKSVATVNPPFPVTSTAITHPENCSAGDGAFTLTASGGTGPYTFTTVPGNNTTMVVNNVSSGTYTTYIQDFKHCTDTLIFLVGNLSTVSANIAAITTVSCHDACSGSVVLNVQNGTPPYTFSATGMPLGTSNTITAMCPGNYLIRILDANLCPATLSLQLANPPALSYSVAQPPPICLGKSGTLTAQAQGGTGSYTYLWNPGSFSGQQVVLSPTTSTVYSLNVFDANGCTKAPYQVTLSVNPPLSVSVNPNSSGICPGTTAQITPSVSGGDGIYSYLWLPGNSTESFLYIENITVPTYTLILSDNCGSPPVAQVINLQVFNVVPPTFTTTNSKGCEPFCTTFINTSSGSLKTYWSFGDDAEEGIGDTAQNCYQNPGFFNILLTVLDQHSCTASAWFTKAIEVFPKPRVDFLTDPPKISRSKAQAVELKEASNNAVDFSWYKDGTYLGSGSSLVTSFPDTLCYQVKLIARSAQSCVDSIQKPVCVYEDFNFFMPNAFSANKDGLNDLLLPKGTGWESHEYSFEIYNRWGHRVFYTTNQNEGWDGDYRINNANATKPKADQENAYVWVVQILDKIGTKHRLNGSVVLLR